MQLKSPFIAFTSIVCVAALSPATRPVSTSTTLSPCYTSLTSSVTASITHVSKTQIVLQPVTSAVITLGPNEFEKHDPRRKRQECFNDQGFSVDCATWTGYYYTWGPPGNPYEGGPGEGGGGSGSGEPQTTIISYAGNAAATRAYGCAGLLLGLVAFLL
jgi:hypothetical protein